MVGREWEYGEDNGGVSGVSGGGWGLGRGSRDSREDAKAAIEDIV